MHKPPPSEISLLTRKRILVLVCLLLLLYIVVPRIGSFSESFTVLRRADPAYAVMAAALTAVTYAVASATYWSLALRPLRYRQTLLVQVASAFTNRLLPGGLGTLTLFVQYLRRRGHTFSQAVTVAGTNNLLGIVGHLIILAGVLLATSDAYPAEVDLPSAYSVWLVLGIVIAIIAANLLVFRRLRQHAYRVTKEVVNYVLLYRKRPARLLLATALSCGLTVLYVTIFYCCVTGVGLHLSVAHIFLVFTIGMIVGTATPTPGGLVGAEAGLTGGLIAYGASADSALAAALLYRFLTYWLPLLPGFITFVKIRRLYSKA
jgi:uncharacterized protein (TIRG00374 family)